MTWFDIGDPAVFGSPGSFQRRPGLRRARSQRPAGIGNLGNFIYVGTGTGQIFVTQDGGGSGASNNWLNISLGLDGSAVKSIITDPTRGSHDAYAVTTRCLLLSRTRFCWEIIPPTRPTSGSTSPSNLHNLPYTIFGQTYNPTTDPNSTKYNQAQNALSSIVADWRYTIPNSANDPNGPGFHPVLYVGSGNSGGQGQVSTSRVDDGLTWTLFPSTTFGAVAQGGNLPHVAVTSLSLSLGNIDPTTGMPKLAGPLRPDQSDVHAGPRPPDGRDLRPGRVRHQPGASGLPGHCPG